MRMLGTLVSAAAILAGCASKPRDGVGSRPPDLSGLVDATPRIETLRSSGGTSKPYVAGGRYYTPITDDRPLREQGLASWYGRQFHGQSTASGEPYDMYAMTAAHKTLPLPSYVRVRNPSNGREAIVRVNDRGPFHDDRVIDLSYAAAYKLDLLRGVAPVEIERITNEDIRTGAWQRGAPADGAATAVAAAAGSTPARFAPVSGGAVAVDRSLRPSSVAASRGDLQIAQASTDDGSGTGVSTSPVLAQPQTEVRELSSLPPLQPAPASPGASAPTPMPSPAGSASLTPSRTGGEAGDLATAGFWVQLGAFSQAEGAERLRQQAARGMPELSSSLNVFGEKGTYRVQAGPYASRDSAREAAERVQAGLKLAPVVVERR